MRDTGSLLEDYQLICEAAARALDSRGDLAEIGLDVASTGDGGCEVRHKGLVVFRCRRDQSPDVYWPGEWTVRLVNAARSEEAEL